MRVQIERRRVQIERPSRSNPRETKTRLSNGFIVPITPTGLFSSCQLIVTTGRNKSKCEPGSFPFQNPAVGVGFSRCANCSSTHRSDQNVDRGQSESIASTRSC